MKMSVKYGVTINLDAYESARIDLGIEREIDPKAFGKEWEKSIEYLRSQVDRKAVEVKQANQKWRKTYNRRHRNFES